MSSEPIKLRIKKGLNEIEIESTVEQLNKISDAISEIFDKISDNNIRSSIISSNFDSNNDADNNSSKISTQLPEFIVSKDESLSSILLKIFQDKWAKNPKKLGEIRKVLQSYGLSYPKQSVAVALLRLAQSGKLRRFKSNDGEYVYTASTAIISNK